MRGRGDYIRELFPLIPTLSPLARGEGVFLQPLLISLALVALASAAQAQNYPAKPLRLVVAFPAGGTADAADG